MVKNSVLLFLTLGLSGSLWVCEATTENNTLHDTLDEVPAIFVHDNMTEEVYFEGPMEAYYDDHTLYNDDHKIINHSPICPVNQVSGTGGCSSILLLMVVLPLKMTL